MSAPAFSLPPVSVKRASYIAIAVAFIHIVFGAVVRITGSGMGCGENWPKCYGYWIPPFERMDLIIEITHRYLALALFVAIVWLVYVAWRARRETSVSGAGGAWNSSRLSLVLWFAPALFGAVTVFTGNPPWATVVHKLLAAALLATLAVTAIRAGGLGGATVARIPGAQKSVGGATAAAVLSLLVVLLGGLTAKLPGAAVACAGFPLCGEGSLGGGAQHVQLTHRIVAYLLVLHLIGLPFVFRKRREATPLMRAAWFTMVCGVLQIVWAAWMVTGGFPSVVRSLHQATGVAIWVGAFTMMYLARIASGRTLVAMQTEGS